MRFSLFYNGDVTPDKTVRELYSDIEAQAVLADYLNFDAFWLAEHHFAEYGKIPNPLQFLTHLGAITGNIKLGTAVVEAPHYHPLRLAEDAALLDLLSNGRVRLGIGSGARSKPQEFAHFAIPIEQKTARTLEITEIVHQAFDRGLVNFQGAFYQYQNVEINPRPVQAAKDLIWLAASESTYALAAERGYGFLLPRAAPQLKQAEVAEKYWNVRGKRAGYLAALRFVYVAETEREAQEQTRRTFERYSKYDQGVVWDGRVGTNEYYKLAQQMNMVIGTPDQVSGQLQEWQNIFGLDEVICQFYAAGSEQDQVLNSLRLFADEVAPRFQGKANEVAI